MTNIAGYSLAFEAARWRPVMSPIILEKFPQKLCLHLPQGV